MVYNELKIVSSRFCICLIITVKRSVRAFHISFYSFPSQGVLISSVVVVVVVVVELTVSAWRMGNGYISARF